ncbi:MAG TPA: CopG family transcriptional regulator [Actinobacteria bacterium]|nr:CopG family transcriptional regulator [Actinomycetota bacterium]
MVGTKVKFTVTVERDLVKKLDEEAKNRQLSRSALVEEAIKVFGKKQLEESLKTGYRAMAEENLKVAEEIIHYGSEAMDEE